jgi:hypothetical protein
MEFSEDTNTIFHAVRLGPVHNQLNYVARSLPLQSLVLQLTIARWYESYYVYALSTLISLPN